MKRCSLSLTVRKMLLKIRSHAHPLEWLRLKGLTLPRAGEVVEPLGPVPFWRERWKTGWQFLTQLHLRI